MQFKLSNHLQNTSAENDLAVNIAIIVYYLCWAKVILATSDKAQNAH